MSISRICPMVLTAFALAACGGGGGIDVASTPPPPPAPPPAPPPPPIIPAATTTQQFAVVGVSRSDPDPAPQFGASEQLQVRYVQSSNSYEVQLPHSQTWAGISDEGPAGSPWLSESFRGDTAALSLGSEDYQYSQVFAWTDLHGLHGYEAIGMATPAAEVPVTGSASYSGQILGSSPEDHTDFGVTITGSINLSFDFGLGNLSGSINPILEQTLVAYPLDAVSFRDTVYSKGSTTFSGKFDTNLAGLNSFSGLFTGPNAQELIGNFALPYRSPLDGHIYQADGAFVGAR